MEKTDKPKLKLGRPPNQEFQRTKIRTEGARTMTSTTIEPEIIRRLRTRDMVSVSRQYMRTDVAERICRTHFLYCDYYQSSGVFEFRKWGIGAPWLPDPEAFRVQIVFAGQGEQHP